MPLAWIWAARGNLVFERLLEGSVDEPASAYGRLAEGVAVDEKYRWVAFKLRPGARWHDGEPVTAEDVKFSFDAFKEHGSVALKTAFTDLERVEIIGARELCFVTRPGAEINSHHAVCLRRHAHPRQALLGAARHLEDHH